VNQELPDLEAGFRKRGTGDQTANICKRISEKYHLLLH